MSADPHRENAPFVPIFPEGEPGSGWPEHLPGIQPAGATAVCIEPGGMVDIALRELGAKLVCVTAQERPPSRGIDLPPEGRTDPSPDAPSPF